MCENTISRHDYTTEYAALWTKLSGNKLQLQMNVILDARGSNTTRMESALLRDRELPAAASPMLLTARNVMRTRVLNAFAYETSV